MVHNMTKEEIGQMVAELKQFPSQEQFRANWKERLGENYGVLSAIRDSVCVGEGDYLNSDYHFHLSYSSVWSEKLEWTIAVMERAQRLIDELAEFGLLVDWFILGFECHGEAYHSSDGKSSKYHKYPRGMMGALVLVRTQFSKEKASD